MVPEKADLTKIFFWKALPQQKEYDKAHLLGFRKNVLLGSIHEFWILAHK